MVHGFSPTIRDKTEREDSPAAGKHRVIIGLCLGVKHANRFIWNKNKLLESAQLLCCNTYMCCPTLKTPYIKATCSSMCGMCLTCSVWVMSFLSEECWRTRHYLGQSQCAINVFSRLILTLKKSLSYILFISTLYTLCDIWLLLWLQVWSKSLKLQDVLCQANWWTVAEAYYSLFSCLTLNHKMVNWSKKLTCCLAFF